MNHLLIWEEVPENTKAYVLVPGKDDELIALAQAAHGYFINAEENEAIHKLNDALYGVDGLSGRELDYDMQQAGKEHIPGPFAAVYICGFIM